MFVIQYNLLILQRKRKGIVKQTLQVKNCLVYKSLKENKNYGKIRFKQVRNHRSDRSAS